MQIIWHQWHKLGCSTQPSIPVTRITLDFDYGIPSETFNLPLLHPWKQTWKPKNWWFGSMFLLGTRVCIYFLRFKMLVFPGVYSTREGCSGSRTSVPRWPSRTWQMWEASAHEKPEKEKPKKPNTREEGGNFFGHIFSGGWKLQHNQWFF